MTPRLEATRIMLPARGGRPLTATLTWRDVAGQPAPDDLSVRMEGTDEPILQVFTARGLPFARARLDVVPLRPATPYRLSLTRRESTDGPRLHVTLRDRRGRAILADRRPLDAASAPRTIEFAVPRSSMVAEHVRLDLPRGDRAALADRADRP